jgi:hypothetical protein
MNSITVDSSSPAMVCPECGDKVIEQPPREWITRIWEPAPRYSHTDGESLCAVMTRDGYRPAEPTIAG